MDILTPIGSQLDPFELQANVIAAKGNDILFLNIYEEDYKYTEALEDLNNLLFTLSNDECDLGFFSLENWDNGTEGFIGDMWFNFVEFIKKIVRTIRTIISHFLQGMSFKLHYLEDMSTKLRGSSNLNIANFENTKMLAYSKSDFEDILRALDILKRTLNSLFTKQDFDLDSIMDFRKYGIVFNKGAIVKDIGNGKTSTEFSFGYDQDGTKSLYKLGWNMSAISPLLDRLIETVKYDIKKDFEYVNFQSAMDKLIRNKDQETKRDYNEITRLTNIAKSMAAMVSYNTKITWKLVKQMTDMLKALEAPIKEPRNGDIYS